VKKIPEKKLKVIKLILLIIVMVSFTYIVVDSLLFFNYCTKKFEEYEKILLDNKEYVSSFYEE